MARKSKPDEGSSTPAPARDMAITTFRLTREQLYWLADEAERRRRARGFGRPDASEVVRELIEEAMRKGGGK